MYILVKKSEKDKMGYKGKTITDENVNSYPEKLLKIWEKAKLIKVKKVKPEKSNKTEDK